VKKSTIKKSKQVQKRKTPEEKRGANGKQVNNNFNNKKQSFTQRNSTNPLNQKPQNHLSKTNFGVFQSPINFGSISFKIFGI